MTYIDYVHVYNTFLVSNSKSISKVSKLLLKNMGKTSGTCQDPDKVIFNFLSYNLLDHEKPKAIEYSGFLLPFEMLFRESTNMGIGNFNKKCVKSIL